MHCCGNSRTGLTDIQWPSPVVAIVAPDSEESAADDVDVDGAASAMPARGANATANIASAATIDENCDRT
jgi:hypothetical protein